MRDVKVLTEADERILELIPQGRNNAVHLRDLISYTGFNHMAIKTCVQNLRQYYPVCSGPEGYWIGSKQDMQELITSASKELETSSWVLDNLMKVHRLMED